MFNYNCTSYESRNSFIEELENDLAITDETLSTLRKKMCSIESNAQIGKDYYFTCLKKRKLIKQINMMVKQVDHGVFY